VSPVAIITGAGRGIGRAAALALAEAGYRLALAARTGDELAETARLAGRADSLVRPTDVTREEQVDALVRSALDAFGRIDAVVHCAGVAPAVSVADMPPAQWRDVIDANLNSAFYLAHAVWPTFAAQRAGVIVNISSMAARDPFPGFAAYAAAKAGLHLLGLVLAREGAPIGVRAHTIAPGAVETAMLRKLMSAEQWGTDKTLDPADVARVIAQCVTGELRHASGEVIYLHKAG